MAEQRELEPCEFTIKMRMPDEPDYYDMTVHGRRIGQFAIAEMPSDGGWTITHIPSGATLLKGGCAAYEEDAVKLAIMADDAVGDADLLALPLPMAKIEALYAAIAKWEGEE